MESVTVAMLGGPGAKELADKIAKKGGETDVTQYNHKEGDRSLTIFVPAKYPDKIQGVSYALQAVDHVVIVVDELNRELGEQIVACDAAEKKQGFILLRNYIQPDQVQPLIKGTNLEGYEVLDTEEPGLLREKFMQLSSMENPGETRVDVDQHFNVKGVGTVVLGVVNRGEVKKHQELIVHPGTKKCIVRSIQVHDTDMDTAGVGSRVGLALKNIDSDDLDRGNILAPADTVAVHKGGEGVTVKARVPAFYKAGIPTGKVLHAGVGMQFFPVKVTAAANDKIEAGSEGELTIEAQNPFVVTDGDRLVLFDLDNAGLRVAAGANLA